MTKKWIAFSLVAILVSFWSCKRDEDEPPKHAPQLSFVFAPYFNDEEVKISERFTNDDGYPIDLHNLAFYLSDIALIDEYGTEVAISEIEIIHLRNEHRSLTFEVPVGDYWGFRFNLGVPPELNSPSNPEFSIGAFDADHPLSESNGMFWDWQGGYRHFSIDGHCDTVPNQGEFLPLSFGFHTGHDELFRMLPDFEYPFQITHNDLKIIQMSVNLNTFFKNGNSHIDLKNERQYHGSEDTYELGVKVAENSAASFEIKN